MGRSTPPLYVNSVGVEGSPFDVTLDFRRRPRSTGLEAAEGRREFADGAPMTSVVMSWEHAKLFHHILGQMLEQIEAERGEIPLMIDSITTETKE